MSRRSKRKNISQSDGDSFWRSSASHYGPLPLDVPNQSLEITKPEPPSFIIKNIKPKKSLLLTITVPKNTSFVDQNFPKVYEFDQNDNNLITEVTTIIDTVGIYNVQKTEILVFNDIAIPVIAVVPGYYDIDELEAKCRCNIPKKGPSARYAFLSYDTTFPANSRLAVILGFATTSPLTPLTIQANPNVPPVDLADGDPLPFVFQNLVDISYGYNLLFVKCNLIDAANSFGNNYISTSLISATDFGELVAIKNYVNKPIITPYVSSVYIQLYDRDGDAYKINSDVQIIINIDIYDK